MKRIIVAIFSLILFSSCGSDELVLPDSVSTFGKVLVVTDNSKWQGEIGDQIRKSFGQLQVGLPQPEKLLSTAQVSSYGFSSGLKLARNILILEVTDTISVRKVRNRYARPQTVVYVTAKTDEGLLNLLEERSDELIDIFRASDINHLQTLFKKQKLDDSKYKTLQNLNISLTIPDSYRTVDDTGDFLWLRQHLQSGIARGAGNNNILVYSLPLQAEDSIADSIIGMRDAIGEKYIPGSKEGMYMITEAAYTPFTVETEIKNRKAFETRGKWEVKNDFMAGPFLNYAIVDKKNNRLLVVEGFTYAPSVNKRNFVMELEAIAKSVEIK
jgi:hypothetical protein